MPSPEFTIVYRRKNRRLLVIRGNGPGAEVEKEYDYLLYVHCGVRWARVDGVWWQTTPLDHRNANPPAGWGNPYDAGKLELVDRNVAVYHGGPGVSVRFERTELVDTPFACE